MVGVAPGVNLFGVRVLGCEGWGYLEDAIAGMMMNLHQPTHPLAYWWGEGSGMEHMGLSFSYVLKH